MMRELALFAGAGGGLLATHHLLGWQCVGYVEMAEYPCKVLEARIKDGLLSPAPIFQMHTGDFIRLGYPAKYRGVVDVITAGFPCQPFSNAGKQQAGDDERNGWPDTIRIIREVRPEWVFLENVTGLLAGSHGYFGTVLGELAESGYDVVWRVLSAAEVGAPHKRDRVWIVAHDNSGRCWPKWERGRLGQVSGRGADQSMAIKELGATVAHANDKRQPQPERVIGKERGWPGYSGQELADANGKAWSASRPTGETIHESERSSGPGRRGGVSQSGEWWAVEPGLGRVVNGMANRLDRVRAIGGGQVPGVVRDVWQILTGKSFNGR